MKLSLKLAIAAAAFGATSPALATDTDPCPAGLVCASKPALVLSAVQDAGYKAKLEKDGTGDPMISSSASGYNFYIYFYGCKDAAQCDSLQFRSSFEQDGANNAALANKWNLGKRFGQAAVDEKGSFIIGYDISTLGGLTPKNFADVIDWWQVTLGNLRTFFKENPAPSKAK